METSYLGVSGLLELQHTIEQVQTHFRPDLQILGYLPTLCDEQRSEAQEILVELGKRFGSDVLPPIHKSADLTYAHSATWMYLCINLPGSAQTTPSNPARVPLRNMPPWSILLSSGRSLPDNQFILRGTPCLLRPENGSMPSMISRQNPGEVKFRPSNAKDSEPVVERIERLKPSQMMPDRFQPRRMLPADIRVSFFAGAVDCYQAAEEWLSQAKSDDATQTEINR